MRVGEGQETVRVGAGAAADRCLLLLLKLLKMLELLELLELELLLQLLQLRVLGRRGGGGIRTVNTCDIQGHRAHKKQPPPGILQ